MVQTTLLGVAIALIVALVAALVGPLVIDWSTYRGLFEAEASHLVGVDVRVTGPIEARLLPSPRLVLHGIEIGGADKVRARALAIEFALGPLMRGEWQASEMHLTGPQVTLGLDPKGHVRAPNLAVAFNPDALAIERLSIEDGTITLSDAANGAKLTLDKVWFNGEARSLLGPFKGEGAATIGGDLYPYRLAAGRYGADGVKLHLNVDPVAHPLAMQADGMLTFIGGSPQFDGKVSLARPVGMAGHEVTDPWRVSGKIKVNAQSALMESAEFRYGSEDRGLSLAGVLDFKFGRTPRIDAVLSGRQVDLDRALAGEGGRSTPAAVIRRFAAWTAGAFRPSFPVKIGIGINQVTLASGTLQNLRGDLSSDGDGWSLDRFEFRAPGFTQVRLSGRLSLGTDAVTFTGPAAIDSNSPKALAAWLEGRGDSDAGDARPLTVRGDVTLGGGRVAIIGLRATVDQKTITGRLDYALAAAGHPARLDAALDAPQIDLDAALGFAKAMLKGSTIERPQDMTVAANFGSATIAGFTARDAHVRLKANADGLQIDTLSIADLGGAKFSASGRIAMAPSPQGSVRFDLNAPDPAPLVAVVGRLAPDTAQVLGAGLGAAGAAALHGELSLAGSAKAAQGKLDVTGTLGKVRVALSGTGHVDAAHFAIGDVRLDGKIDSDDGHGLVSLLGLDRYVDAGAGAGALTLTAAGPARGTLRIAAQLTAGGLEADVTGSAAPFAGSPNADLQAKVVRGNAAPLRARGAEPLPLAGSAHLVLAGRRLTVDDIAAHVGADGLRGKLALDFGDGRHIVGEIDADNADGAALVAAAIGLPPAASGGQEPWSWSSEPFGPGIFGRATGTVVFKARRIDLLPHLIAREFKTTVHLREDGVSFDDIAGTVAGGRLGGRLDLRRPAGDMQAHAEVSLAGADAASLLGAGARPPVAGALTVTGTLDGTGLSPVALVGSLHGAGKITLGDGSLAGLDPRAFAAVTRAVDQGLAVEPARIGDMVRKGLDSGQLALAKADGDLVVNAGQVRLDNVQVKSAAADLTANGTLDLTDGLVDARLVLTGAAEAAGARPDIYMALKGPIGAPARSLDVSALVGWLTLRSVENQAKRLQAVERAAPKAETSNAEPPKNELPTSEPSKREPPKAEPAAPAYQDHRAPADLPHASAPVLSAPRAVSPPLPPARAQMPRAHPSQRTQRAPTLPPPIDIRPRPEPLDTVAPRASVGR